MGTIEILVLPFCIIAIASTFYSASAFRQGNLRGAKAASMICIAACSFVAALNVVLFMRVGGVFNALLAMVWAWLAYREIVKLNIYNRPPPGPGNSDQDQGNSNG